MLSHDAPSFLILSVQLFEIAIRVIIDERDDLARILGCKSRGRLESRGLGGLPKVRKFGP
jgi:hypothetical protein